MRKSQTFWDKNAGRYDRFMRKDAAAYERLYSCCALWYGKKPCWSWRPAQADCQTYRSLC